MDTICIRCGKAIQFGGVPGRIDCCRISYVFSQDANVQSLTEREIPTLWHRLSVPISLIAIALSTYLFGAAASSSPRWANFLFSALVSIFQFALWLALAHGLLEHSRKKHALPSWNNDMDRMLLIASTGIVVVTVLVVVGVFPIAPCIDSRLYSTC